MSELMRVQLNTMSAREMVEALAVPIYKPLFVRPHGDPLKVTCKEIQPISTEMDLYGSCGAEVWVCLERYVEQRRQELIHAVVEIA